jgi:glycosyltransferase involved in cell wall biosynthesis
MKIFALHNNSGSRYYRLIPQLKRMQELGHEVILEPHDCDRIRENIEWADVVIFEMIFSPEWISFAKKKGKKVIFECDDLVHSVPKDHYSYKDVKGFGRFKLYFKTWQALRMCDGFISTCENLNRTYGWMANKSLVFKNYVDFSHWLRPYQKNTTERIRILWGGSTSHTPDLLWIKPVMDRILRKYPQVQFIYVGHGGVKSLDLNARFVYGEDLFDGLPDNREAMLSYPPNVWPFVLASLQADFAIAPLVKNRFNKAKSQCKFLEYSVNRIPGIYSGWHYTDVKGGKTGLTADSLPEWESAIESLIESPTLRQSLGNAAYDEVFQKHDIRLHIDRWTDFVQSL